jgi:hypothetical protein
MREAKDLLFPKLTEENIKSLEDQISKLELLGKLRSRVGKLPPEHKAVLQQVMDDITTANACSNVIPALTDEQLHSLWPLIIEGTLTSAKEHLKISLRTRQHLSVDEHFALVLTAIVSSDAGFSAFLRLVHTFREKLVRSPESPQ